MAIPTVRRKALNTKQLALLKVLYRYRFATPGLLAQYFNLTQSTINERLTALVTKEYIGRKYEPAYRLRGQQASYHLLPKGITSLRRLLPTECNPAVLKNMYKDRDASDAFIAHWLTIFEICNQISGKFGERVRHFTKCELAGYTYFPKPLPDLFLRLKSNEKERQFFIDLIAADVLVFIAMRRVKEYIDYAESGEWDTATKYQLPKVLLIHDSASLGRTLQKYIDAQMEEYFEEDLTINLATKGEVLAALDPEK